MIAPADLTGPISDEDVDWAIALLKLRDIDAPRRAFLKSLRTLDVAACPGSGKTTLVVAKLAILARKWKSATRGICVLSHTNVAREEISHRLGNTHVGQRLLAYPHFIDTIHGFVSRFLSTPWLHSAGYRIAAIDDDMTMRARRRALSYMEHRALETFLGHKNLAFESLRLGSANFASPLSGAAFPSGPHTDTYKYASKALRSAAEQGYFCYDEIFLLGEALLAQCPDLPGTLQSRFPFVLVDEMQDSSEQQCAFLRKLFPRDEAGICVQRVGDPNQSIFEDEDGPVADAFPDASRRVDISDSPRFDASVASLANPFAHSAVLPKGLKGTRVHEGAPTGYAHTVFVFPDDDASGVLAAYGRHVLDTLPNRVLISSGAVTAVGAVHKPFPEIGPGHAHYPKTVSHYWDGYQLGADRLTHRPATLAEAILSAQKLSSSGGPLHRCVDGVASAISHLANLQAGAAQMKASSRQHLQVERRLAAHRDARAIYRDLLARYLVDRQPLDQAQWNGLLPRLRQLGAAVGAGDVQAASADAYLAWPTSPAPLPPPQPTSTLAAAANCYRYTCSAGSVDIHLGSIHKAKGQTHVATLVLETYNRTHFLDALMPWMVGKNVNGTKCTNPTAAQRLMQAYVAMTRPTYLLCAAIRASSLEAGKGAATNTQRLIDRGWKVQHHAK
jgi:DNA helicase-2/ATP-dependent DNA helicase PcrA